ncbi:MAG: galactokinase family protein [Clostridia bacterium]|nr:galactokinase family protein [Clostridia bacterium]
MITDFNELYAGNTEIQKKRYSELTEHFSTFFDINDGIEYFSAPGRTEVGGNHTDHQHGRVLAAAVNMDIIAAAVKTDDNIITLKSHEYEKVDRVDVSVLDIQDAEREKSASLIRGVCARCVELGYKAGGFSAYTMSSVLKGSGLSSSAAFEVLVVTILNHLYNDDKISAVEVAQIAQYAENVYFGKPSGLMDQTASSVGGFTAIDFNDPKSPKLEKIDFDLKKYGHNLCIVDTKGSHADLTGEYASIPVEMKSVAGFFGKEVLRDVDEIEFVKNIAVLREKFGDRAVLRAMHFFDDNRTALDEAEALKAGDFEKFLTLVKKSGTSSLMKLQNVFASSAPSQQGITLGLAVTERILNGKGTFRVHGGGFAGTMQAYVPDELLAEYISGVESVFGEGSCHVLSVRNAGGTKVIGI